MSVKTAPSQDSDQLQKQDSNAKPKRRNAWQWLTEPSASVVEPEERRRAQLLSALLLVLIFATVLGYLARPEALDLLGAFGVIVGAYVLSRTSQYRIGAVFALVIMSVPSVAAALTETELTSNALVVDLIWLALPILLSSLILSVRGTAIIGFGNFAFVAVLPALIPDLPFTAVLVPLGFTGILASLVVLAAIIRRRDLLQVEREFAERREAEESLRTSEARYRTILENIQDGYFETSVEGDIVFFNKAFQSMIGYSQEELQGVSYKTLMDEENSRKIFELFNNVFTTGKPNAGFDWKINDKAGNPLIAEASVSLIEDVQGEKSGFRGVIRDITDRKQAEERIRYQNEALVQANTDLARAREEAEEGNRLKSEFLATMSHELRTPLNAVIGYTDLLLKGVAGSFSTKQDDFLNRILSNGERLLALIDDVLDLSKMEAGHVVLVEKPFSPESLLQSLKLQIQGLADEKGLEFTTTVDSGIPQRMMGDPARLERILVNLIGNAIKFTPQGRVDVQFASLDADQWEIRVTDTGVGIPAHAQEIIFDEFRQADGTSQREFGGTGLGLAIVRKLILMMGGKVSVDSEVGKGSTFIVQLPLVEPEPDPVE